MREQMRNFFLMITLSLFMTRIYTVWLLKVANDLSVGDFKNLFDFKDKYTLHIPSVNTELKGKNSIRYFGLVIWNAIPFNIKTATYLNASKNRIKSWKPECPCRLCKTYLQGVVFINITE